MRGKGVRRNYKKAARYFKLAADQGNFDYKDVGRYGYEFCSKKVRLPTFLMGITERTHYDRLRSAGEEIFDRGMVHDYILFGYLRQAEYVLRGRVAYPLRFLVWWPVGSGECASLGLSDFEQSNCEPEETLP